MADLQPPKMLSMNDQSGDDGMSSFLSLGKTALDSGQVTPEDVTNAQTVMNQPDGAKKLQKSLGIGPKDMQLLPAPLRAAMSQMGQTGKGKQTKGTEKMTSDLKQGSTRNVTDTNSLLTNMGAVEQDPYIASQKADIENQQNALSMQQKAPGQNDGWVKPLLALADSQNGGHMADSFVGPEQRQAKQMMAQNALDQRKEALTKLIFEGVKNSKVGTDTTQQNSSMMQELGRIEGMVNGSGDMQQRAEDNRAFRAHTTTIAALQKDPQLKERLTQYTNLGNSLGILQQAGTVTPQQLDEAQQAVRANLGIKGSSGVDERDRTRLNDVMLDVKRSLQKISGKPQDVGADNAILAHIKDLANVERGNIQSTVNARLSALSGGQSWVYDDPIYGAKYKPGLDNVLNGIKGQSTMEVPGKKTGTTPAPAPSGKYPAGRPGKGWTEAQVDAYMSDHQ